MPFHLISPEIKVLAVRWALEGTSHPHICRLLGTQISARSISRWIVIYHQTRAVVRDPSLYLPQGAPGLLTPEQVIFLQEIMLEDPTVYLDEAQHMIYRQTGQQPCTATVWNVLQEQLHLTLKTSRTVHPKQNADKRSHFLLKMADINPQCLVFVDESGISINEVRRTRAWAPRGRRTARLPRPTRGIRYNLISAIAMTGIVGTLVKEGTVKRRHFVWYLRHRLLPFMNPFPGVNSVLVLDNARIHKGEEIEVICEQAGIKLVFLPPYSPDYNPIEKGFSVFKANLRRSKNLECDDIINEIYSSVETVFSSTMCTKLFKGCAYI